jgi:hypothetical protein
LQLIEKTPIFVEARLNRANFFQNNFKASALNQTQQLLLSQQPDCCAAEFFRKTAFAFT